MAFINLRRKKGIYLGGDARGWLLSFSLFLSRDPLFLFFSFSPPSLFLFSVSLSAYGDAVRCGAKPSAAKSGRRGPPR